MDWKRGPIIGRGASAAVYLATTAAGELFAVKSTDLSSSSLLQKENSLVSQLCSPYVVKCLGSNTSFDKGTPSYNIFLEYVAGGTLSDHIAKQGGSLDEDVIRFYAHQVLLGLDYLHRSGFVHCDIKGQNLLIGDDGGLKIADFGCAKRVESESGPCSKIAIAGTPAYMAPEVARGEEQSFPADIWALGCTVIEMATGSNPWPEMNDPVSALYSIANTIEVPESPSWFSDMGKDFLSKCLNRDGASRWTAGELLRHGFFHDVGENSGKVRQLTRKSPTSVMDQDFWDSLESFSDSFTSTINSSLTADSPANRIRGLIANNFLPEWTEEEEEWTTVRDQTTEVERRHQDSDETTIPEESDAFSEEIETEIVIENLSIDCCLDDCKCTESVRILDASASSRFIHVNFNQLFTCFVIP